jgi:DNA-binding response OmpR family regulator
MQMRHLDLVDQIKRFFKWIVRATYLRDGRNEQVLVISKEDYESIGRFCRRLRWKLRYAADLPTALVNLQDQSFEVVIYDHDLPGQDWRSAVTTLANTAPSSSILLLSPLGHPELWNEVIRRGGHDMLCKPISDESFESAVALAMARAKLTSSLDRRRTDRRGFAAL